MLPFLDSGFSSFHALFDPGDWWWCSYLLVTEHGGSAFADFLYALPQRQTILKKSTSNEFPTKFIYLTLKIIVNISVHDHVLALCSCLYN